MNATELQDQLARIDLFRGLTKRGLRQLVASGRTTTHADGKEVIAEGAGAIGFHLITAGTAVVTTGATVRRTLGPGDYFGEISVIDGKPRSASVVAAGGELETFMIHPTDVQKLLQEHPDLARQLLVLLCARLREAEQHQR